jgi:hypothetical protein
MVKDMTFVLTLEVTDDPRCVIVPLRASTSHCDAPLPTLVTARPVWGDETIFDSTIVKLREDCCVQPAPAVAAPRKDAIIAVFVAAVVAVVEVALAVTAATG